jgi:hypothetical protein
MARDAKFPAGSNLIIPLGQTAGEYGNDPMVKGNNKPARPLKVK